MKKLFVFLLMLTLMLTTGCIIAADSDAAPAESDAATQTSNVDKTNTKESAKDTNTQEVKTTTKPSDIGDLGPEDIIVEAKPATSNNTQRAKKPLRTHNVTIAAYKFNPSNLEVSQGDTVVWRNLGNTPHEVRSLLFHSNPLHKQGTYSHKFMKLGNHTVNSARYPATQMTVSVVPR